MRIKILYISSMLSETELVITESKLVLYYDHSLHLTLIVNTWTGVMGRDLEEYLDLGLRPQSEVMTLSTRLVL